MRSILQVLTVALLLFTSQASANDSKKKIGVCITATGRYIEFIPRLLASAREHFFPEDSVKYFVFTDSDRDFGNDVQLVYQQRLGWPYDTLKRSSYYYGAKDLFDELDYVFALDADMLFVARVDKEILGNTVGTTHPGYWNKRPNLYPYETRRRSSAYVPRHKRRTYFAGAFYGGTKDGFIRLLETVNNFIEKDESRGLIAKWHDESYLNKYFSKCPPVIKLTPEYCFPSTWKLPFVPKIFCLDKPEVFDEEK